VSCAVGNLMGTSLSFEAGAIELRSEFALETLPSPSFATSTSNTVNPIVDNRLHDW